MTATTDEDKEQNLNLDNSAVPTEPLPVANNLDAAEKGENIPTIEFSKNLDDDNDATKKSESNNDGNKKPSKLRDSVSFWILACCNNFGYTLLLTAAHDILQEGGEYVTDENVEITRNCNLLSTGSILLADALPGLFIKIIAPFFPASGHLRMIITVILYASGLFLVAFSPTVWIAILGTAVTSLANGFGEVTCLSQCPYYPRGILGAWSSGLAASGLLASMSLALITFFGYTTRTALKIMLFIPFLMAFTFWFLLSKGEKPQKKNIDGTLTAPNLISTSGDKIKSLPSLMKYMLPTSTVYLFQYFINQGLSELVQFDNIWLNQGAQYRWIQVSYQSGKFIAQSSRSLVKINKIWLLVFLQFLNICFFSCEVVFYIAPVIPIVFAFSFWEGLVGGATYLNVIRKVSIEVPTHKQDFALVMCSLSDSIGITVSGFLAIPVHNLLCRLPKPERLTF